MIRWITKVALLSLSLAISVPAFALQVLEGVDGQTLVGKVSVRELTRITVAGARIKRVTGNAGDFLLEKDEDRGQIYIRPAPDSPTKPINVFVATERATYTLLLQPVDLPADTIVIRPPAALKGSRIERASAHVRAIKNLLLAMADDGLPRDMDVREVKREVQLWKDVRFTLARVYLGADLVGEKYLLTNLGHATTTLTEQSLFKSGVLAVSVENTRLEPAQSTNVFVIRERTDHD